MVDLKEKILSELEGLLKNKAKDMQDQLILLQTDSAGSAKSSMGDKYETTREMLKQEEEKVGHQLARCKKDLQMVTQQKDQVYQTVQAGSLVRSNEKYFLLLMGIGPLAVGEMEVFVISPASPIGQALLGKKKGDFFVFNKMEEKIDDLV